MFSRTFLLSVLVALTFVWPCKADTHYWYQLTPANTDMSYDTVSTVWTFSGIEMSNAAGPALLDEAASATNPTVAPNKADGNSGLAWASSDTLTFVVGGAEAGRISSSGNWLVGHTASVSPAAGAEMQIHTDSWGALALFDWDSDATAPYLYFCTSASNTKGSYSALGDNRQLGAVSFYGDDGTDLNTQAAIIYCITDGAASSNSVPAELVFQTNPGAANPATALIIHKDKKQTVYGDVNPNADGTLNLGTQTTAQWANVWSDLINGSDIALENQWRMLEAEKYERYPQGWALASNEAFTPGEMFEKMPREYKPLFVVTRQFVEYDGERITAKDFAAISRIRQLENRVAQLEAALTN